MDQVRKEIFVRKFEQEGKTTDLSFLLTRASNLNLHTNRVNYIARIYKQANNLMMNLFYTMHIGKNIGKVTLKY